jgi:hypothetical protein
MAVMADGDHVNLVVEDVLWDADGQEWTTKRSRWATAKQASGYIGREAPVALLDTPGQPLTWMNGQQSQQWWAHARLHFDVPGTLDAEADESNHTWAAHIWERGDDRLLVFETRR